MDQQAERADVAHHHDQAGVAERRQVPRFEQDFDGPPWRRSANPMGDEATWQSLRDPATNAGYYSDGRFVPTPHVRDLPITYARPYANGQMPTSAEPLPSFDSAWWLSPELRSITGIDGPSAPTAPPARPSALDDVPLPSRLMGGGTTPAPQSYPASPLDMTSYDWRTGRWATSPAPGDPWPGGRGQLPFLMQDLPPSGAREEGH